MTKGQVLLVDDENFSRRLYGDYLTRSGYEVVTVGSSDHALDVASARHFDVIVTDLVMPGLDGLGLLSELRRRGSDVGVIVITALDEVAPAVRAIQSGAQDYLIKPVAMEALQLAVSRCIATRRLLRENQSLRHHVTLFESCQRLVATLDREKLFPLALYSLAAEAEASLGALFTLAPNGEFALVAQLDLPPEAPGLYAGALSPLLADPGASARLVEPERLPPELRAGPLALVPCCHAGRAVAAAALAFGPRGAPGPEKLRACEYLGRHVGLALENATRFAAVKDLAFVDDLTGLHNFRYLHLTLDRLTLSPLEGQIPGPFSLLFLDVDYFKKVNDQHGHTLGSALLVEVGKILRGAVRDGDVVCRYGGDEYTVVLPGTGPGGASAVAERIRKRLAEHRFLAREGLNLRVTACIGVASCPEDGVDKETMLKLADEAMYLGKKGERNEIHRAGEERALTA